MSLPVRERGLKFKLLCRSASTTGVAPRAGAWIEMIDFVIQKQRAKVAPRAGAWIEIF